MGMKRNLKNSAIDYNAIKFTFKVLALYAFVWLSVIVLNIVVENFFTKLLMNFLIIFQVIVIPIVGIAAVIYLLKLSINR